MPLSMSGELTQQAKDICDTILWEGQLLNDFGSGTNTTTGLWRSQVAQRAFNPLVLGSNPNRPSITPPYQTLIRESPLENNKGK